MDSVEKFFRENPHAWMVGVVAVLVLGFSVWGIWGGFSFQAGQSFAGNCEQGPLPAVSGQGSFFHSTCDGALAAQFGVSPPEPIAGCIGVLDFTAKSDDNRPGFTTRDPEWTCTGPFTLSRTTCFNPRGQITGKGNVSCSADMGSPLGVKTINFTVSKGLGDSNTSTVKPVVLSVQCNLGRNVLSWTTPLPAGSNASAINKTITPRGGVPRFVQIPINLSTNPSSYIDTDVQDGFSYSYTFKNSVSTVSNSVACSFGPSTAPVPAATPTPVVSPLQCAPITQTVPIRQPARLDAAGGDGRYQWITDGGVLAQGGAQFVVVTYTTPGLKTVRVNSQNQSASCTVSVTNDAASTPSPTTIGSIFSVLDVQKSGRNITAGDVSRFIAISVDPEEIAEFTVSITNNGTTVLSGLRVLDALPGGMSYVAGSTLRDGQPLLVDTITSTGFVLGDLQPGATVTVRWSAVADVTGQLAAGPTQFQPRASVTANGIPGVSADMSVTVFGFGFTGSDGSPNVPGDGSFEGNGTAGDVATGPGDAVTIALVMAAALTLLYSGYTRSSGYRRTEADTISRRQEPMDFRS